MLTSSMPQDHFPTGFLEADLWFPPEWLGLAGMIVKLQKSSCSVHIGRPLPKIDAPPLPRRSLSWLVRALMLLCGSGRFEVQTTKVFPLVTSEERTIEDSEDDSDRLGKSDRCGTTWQGSNLSWCERVALKGSSSTLKMRTS